MQLSDDVIQREGQFLSCHSFSCRRQWPLLADEFDITA